MRGRLSLSAYAVVTACATSNHFIMVHFGGGHPRSICVACIARVRRGNMRGRFTFGGHTVVTARARSHHLGMIHL